MSVEAGYGVAAIGTFLVAYTAMTLGTMRAVGMAGYYQDRGEAAPLRNVVRGAAGIVVAGASLLALALLALAAGVIEGTAATIIVTVAALLALASVVAAGLFSRRLFSYPPVPRSGTLEVQEPRQVHSPGTEPVRQRDQDERHEARGGNDERHNS